MQESNRFSLNSILAFNGLILFITLAATFASFILPSPSAIKLYLNLAFSFINAIFAIASYSKFSEYLV